ncbi:MAG: hypothetical protein H3C26_19025 [Rhodocyclaceae bacterium]|nr:hypothetical protein [Rhodocyclaceae bacterium]
MKSGRFHDRWCLSLLSRIVFLAAAWAMAVGAARAAPADPFAGRRVLVLNSYTEGVGAHEEIISGFFAGVAAAGGRNDSVYTEKLDLLRFGTATHRQALVELLRTRYASRQIDLLVTVQQPALDFALDEGRALFAGVPTIAAMVPEESFAGAAHPHVVRLPYEIDFSGTLDHARRLFPDTRRVVVAGGIGPADRVFIAQAKRAFASRQGEFEFEYLDDGDLERSLERIGRLPAGSVAIILTHYQTRTGLSVPHRGVLMQLARAASVPAFTQWASLLQDGAMVGGSVLDVSAMGRQAAEAAIDYLAGRKTLAQLRELPAVGSMPIFDWAQVERWRGDVSRLPAHSVFIGRPASLWAGHRHTVIVWLAVMAGLAGLLVALVVTNGRYRRTVRDHADRRDHLEGLVAERTQALAAALERAEAANRAKSVFLSSMSHELRTPLNSVIGFSALIARAGNLDESTRCNLEIINRSGRHLLTLINNILELSKIEAGRIELEEASTDVAALAREVADMLLPQAEQAGLALEVNIADLPPALRVDAVKLRQVLLNLLANAIKFTREGSVTLEVRVVSRTLCDARIAFAVRDTGIGIAPEDR